MSEQKPAIEPAPQEPSAETLREENVRLRTALEGMRSTALDALACWQGEDERRYASVVEYRPAAEARGRLRDRMVQIILAARDLQQSISNQPSADTIQAVRALYRDDLDAMADAIVRLRADLAAVRCSSEEVL